MKIRSLTAILFAAAVLAALAVLPRRILFTGGQNYTFYIGTSSADCREVRSVFNPEAERLFLTDVCGESAEFEELDLNEFLKGVNGRIMFKEELSDSVNYYCSADLPYSVELYGKQINLHICVRDNGVKVASPIIFGGY